VLLVSGCCRSARLHDLTAGWIAYYGYFFRTQLRPTLQRIDAYFIRWARRKFKRMRHQTKGARDWFERFRRANPISSQVVRSKLERDMARVFVTGSSTGLGLMAGQLLIEQGHKVVLHGRNHQRANEAMANAPGVEAAVVGDLSTIKEMKSVADQANRLGRFDAVIHNAGVGYRESRRVETQDGVPQVLAVNVLAPYVLTALIEQPDRLVYLSSGMHHSAEANLDDLLWIKRPWRGAQAYAESKLYDAMLAFAVARIWPKVRSNALEPGWVATRMGGPQATGDLSKGHITQAWLAVSNDALALSSGEYFFHKLLRAPNLAAKDERAQRGLLDACAGLSGVSLEK
jgi:NAD(P)-dependent dehydrogenase (short-subunit alcohol dehydrogenase family)